MSHKAPGTIVKILDGDDMLVKDKDGVHHIEKKFMYEGALIEGAELLEFCYGVQGEPSVYLYTKEVNQDKVVK